MDQDARPPLRQLRSTLAVRGIGQRRLVLGAVITVMVARFLSYQSQRRSEPAAIATAALIRSSP